MLNLGLSLTSAAVRAVLEPGVPPPATIMRLNYTGLLVDDDFGLLSNSRTSVATVTDYQGNVIDCVANEIRYHGARRVDHGNQYLYNSGVQGIEYKMTEGDDTTPISPAPRILNEGAATNLVEDSDDPNQWPPTTGASSADQGATWNGMKKVSAITSGQFFHRVETDSIGYVLNINDDHVFTLWYEAGTSNNIRVTIRNTVGGATSLITGPIGSESVSSTAAGNLVLLSAGVVNGNIRKLECRFTPGVTSTFTFGAGPNSTTNGETVFVYGGALIAGKQPGTHIRTTGAQATRTADNIRLPLTSGTNFKQASGMLLQRWIARYASDTTARGLFGAADNVASVLNDSATLNTLSSTDGANTSTVGVTWVAGDELLAAVIWIGSSMAVGISKNGGAWTWSATGTYDTAFTLGTYLNWFYSNGRRCELKHTRIYEDAYNSNLVSAKSWVEANAASETTITTVPSHNWLRSGGYRLVSGGSSLAHGG